ncbi:hypothetical protein [Agriterribacter sp.]|uniref:hypothetical protein n=1 Tax=Agriterribacter sp. TaxID=2821509 RepID=UPI002C3191A7|nr:hypothetical protein [Agriterribacter sp.]HRP57760.1 hypothetical protein [Agriterribacter sp.]
MKRLTLILIALTTYSLLASNHCKKDPAANAKLPPATQEGRNTVGFRIDDEVWIPHYECRFMGNPCGEISARYGESNGAAEHSFDFQILRQKNNKLSALTVSSSGTGTITSVGNKIDSIFVNYDDEKLSSDGYFIGPMPGSRFTITKIDFQNWIISGEFEFILRERKDVGTLTDTFVTLKEGRFDLKFNACTCSN